MCKSLIFVSALLLNSVYCKDESNIAKIHELQAPLHTQRSEQVELYCNYTLKVGTDLGEISWLHGLSEFYKYDPSSRPTQQIFPTNVFDVNRELSDDHKVILENVRLNATGNYTCKVTALNEASGDFDVLEKQKFMEVIVIPRNNPEISLEKENGTNVMNVTCTSSPSIPAANISFEVNEEEVDDKHITHYPANMTSEGLIISKATLHIRPKWYTHPVGSNTSKVECVSRIKTYESLKKITHVEVSTGGEKLMGSIVLLFLCVFFVPMNLQI